MGSFMNTNETYKVGIYLRLSCDDAKYDESQSISNQRDYIMNSIIQNNLMFIDEYVDDSVSGTEPVSAHLVIIQLQ